MKNLANMITIGRVALALIAIILLNTSTLPIIAIILIPIAMILDMFDGMAARAAGVSY